MNGTRRGPEISIRQRLRPAPFRARVLKRLVRAAAGRLCARRADLRIVVVSDAEMERWNRRYRGVSRTTNVLSFAEEEPGEPGGGDLSGDILVSAPTCLRQTQGWPGSPEERVFYFILHGMLHLMGFDHERGRPEAARMRRTAARVYGETLRTAGEGA